MDSCSNNHPQIIHTEPTCPLCDMRDEQAKLMKEISDGLAQIVQGSTVESKSEAA